MRKLTEPGVAARLKSDRSVAQARGLRKSMTPAEKLLWRELRRFAVAGTHWRKQAPLGPFIADFVCHGSKLVVELDGGVHRIPEAELRDQERTAFFAGRGFRTLRYGNVDVVADVGAVVRDILARA